jgi:hypothetical protein
LSFSSHVPACRRSFVPAVAVAVLSAYRKQSMQL